MPAPGALAANRRRESSLRRRSRCGHSVCRGNAPRALHTGCVRSTGNDSSRLARLERVDYAAAAESPVWLFANDTSLMLRSLNSSSTSGRTEVVNRRGCGGVSCRGQQNLGVRETGIGARELLDDPAIQPFARGYDSKTGHRHRPLCASRISDSLYKQM
jgi:hypothetical protein